jgi:hypothetical protein
MRFYFPDSQDQVDPSFDFKTEERSHLRVRQRDDLYAHELLRPIPYRGLLVSKAMIDRYGGAGRYSAQQRQRFYRVGVRKFFRLHAVPGPRIETMGDCGAFSYINDDRPPYTVEEVVEFYEGAGFDAGLSVDHVIPAFGSGNDDETTLASTWQGRYDLTLELAANFIRVYRERACRFQPIGVAQGWSPRSYAEAVGELRSLGYERIALGGLVPLKSHEILATLDAVNRLGYDDVELHLLGVTRCEHVPDFRRYGVTSFDSTSPFRQAFKDARDNYYAPDRTYIALRVPQVEGNARLQARIRAGEIRQEKARELEQDALLALAAFDRGRVGLESALSALCAYEDLHDGKNDRSDLYCEVLAEKPWKRCECPICRTVGVQVMLFRGTERNKRRGFHNLHAFGRRLQREVRRARRRELAAAV